jgi:hypothetical protein
MFKQLNSKSRQLESTPEQNETLKIITLCWRSIIKTTYIYPESQEYCSMYSVILVSIGNGFFIFTWQLLKTHMELFSFLLFT